MLQGQMVRFRWHAEGTERIWIFHSVARMCEGRGRDGAYTGMFVRHVSVGWGEREGERGSADTSDASRTETVLLEMTCYTRLQEFIAGSKFIPRSQLLYGPCMSSLTAAVFTSRLDWYRKSRPLSCRRVFFLLLLRLSSRPYAANNASAWKVYPPPPLPPSSASTSVERWQEVSLFYCLRFCGSLFHTPALHVHVDQRCCSLCNCAD